MPPLNLLRAPPPVELTVIGGRSTAGDVEDVRPQMIAELVEMPAATARA
jgi:hypothetical protein